MPPTRPHTLALQPAEPLASEGRREPPATPAQPSALLASERRRPESAATPVNACTEAQFLASTQLRAQVDELVKKFCFGNAKNIEASLIRKERQELEKVQKDTDEQRREIAAQTEVLKKIRDEIETERKLAGEQIVKIFTDMKPEAAASQFNAMDEQKARAILRRLNSRTASAILNEMQPKKAAVLAEGLLSKQGEAGKP